MHLPHVPEKPVINKFDDLELPIHNEGNVEIDSNGDMIHPVTGLPITDASDLMNKELSRP
jgi:hypothetical protein